MNDPKEYIVHDYSAINRHIEELANREREISKAMQLKNDMKKAIEYVVLICGLGFFAILFAYAVRLVVYSPLS